MDTIFDGNIAQLWELLIWCLGLFGLIGLLATFWVPLHAKSKAPFKVVLLVSLGIVGVVLGCVFAFYEINHLSSGNLVSNSQSKKIVFIVSIGLLLLLWPLVSAVTVIKQYITNAGTAGQI